VLKSSVCPRGVPAVRGALGQNRAWLPAPLGRARGGCKVGEVDVTPDNAGEQWCKLEEMSFFVSLHWPGREILSQDRREAEAALPGRAQLWRQLVCSAESMGGS